MDDSEIRFVAKYKRKTNQLERQLLNVMSERNNSSAERDMKAKKLRLDFDELLSERRSIYNNSLLLATTRFFREPLPIQRGNGRC
jgi:hypothetical protein